MDALWSEHVLENSGGADSHRSLIDGTALGGLHTGACLNRRANHGRALHLWSAV